MKNILHGFIVSCGLAFSALAQANCAAVIRDAYTWASKRDVHSPYRVEFLLSTIKSATKSAHYSQGVFTIAQDGLLSSGRTSAVFSDRAWCPNNSGPFCVPYQKFDYRKADPISFILQRDGILKVVQENNSYDVNLQCSNGFLYGSFEEANGISFLTLNLHKASTRPQQ